MYHLLFFVFWHSSDNKCMENVIDMCWWLSLWLADVNFQMKISADTWARKKKQVGVLERQIYPMPSGTELLMIGNSLVREAWTSVMGSSQRVIKKPVSLRCTGLKDSGCSQLAAADLLPYDHMQQVGLLLQASAHGGCWLLNLCNFPRIPLPSLVGVLRMHC